MQRTFVTEIPKKLKNAMDTTDTSTAPASGPLEAISRSACGDVRYGGCGAGCVVTEVVVGGNLSGTTLRLGTSYGAKCDLAPSASPGCRPTDEAPDRHTNPRDHTGAHRPMGHYTDPLAHGPARPPAPTCAHLSLWAPCAPAGQPIGLPSVAAPADPRVPPPTH